jgi:hypothetical protein
MPLIDISPQGSKKPTLLPAEVCEILPGQAFKGKLSDEHTAQMIIHACKPPNVNARAIVGPGLDNLGFALRSSAETLKRFDIEISDKMAVVPGRILAAPGVMYSTRAQEVDQRASWNLRGVKFSVGASLEKWSVLVIRDGNRNDFQGVNDPDMQSVVKGFTDMCNKSGMRITGSPHFLVAQLPKKTNEDPTRRSAVATIRNTIVSGPKVDLIFVLLSNGDKHIYAGIKHLCDVYLDVHTVCVHTEKIRKGQLQYYANVALKFNAKLGGTNHSLDNNAMAWLRQQPTMLVGMDVTHPGPGSAKGTPSIAAVVASVDDGFAQFPASLQIQETKKEVSGLFAFFWGGCIYLSEYSS